MKLNEISKNIDKISLNGNQKCIKRAIQKTIKENIPYYYNKEYAKFFMKNNSNSL